MSQLEIGGWTTFSGIVTLPGSGCLLLRNSSDALIYHDAQHPSRWKGLHLELKRGWSVVLIPTDGRLARF